MIHFCFHTVHHVSLKYCSHYIVQILTNNKLLQEDFFGNIFHVEAAYIYHGLRFSCIKIQDVSIYLSKGISSREGCKRFSILWKMLKPKNPILHQHEVKVFWAGQTRLVKAFTRNSESHFLLFLTEILGTWSC